MSNIDKISSWFALKVTPRHEKATAQNLRYRGLQEYLPLYRARRVWSDRVKIIDLPLFGNYVFCRFNISQDKLKVLETPSVSSIVGFSGKPTPIDDAEISVLRTTVESGYPVQPWPYLRVGQTVRIQAGALSGLQGQLVCEKGLMRVVINVDLLQRSVAVEIDRDMICAVNETAEALVA